ncbi:hypothetical protein H2200_004695 [Cladophialophora chaetospira]|uniref:Uncharacterized protein n=1 Tax=Cladophialophora chaetospira TaxID=386627 RepID=A0AA38XDK7_9EURO|nr:hypothetical protein H2200_004695 [Cladophialophora chaetospira]
MRSFFLSSFVVTLTLALPTPPSIQWVDCRQHPPLSQNVSAMLQSVPTLPPQLHCGQIAVPADYSKPIGPENNITLGLAMYRPQNPRGAIFFNPGGSDEATIFAWMTAFNLSDTFTGLLDYDLMMMDTRVLPRNPSSLLSKVRLQQSRHLGDLPVNRKASSTTSEHENGSYRAQQYAATFPHRIDRLVLDAVIPHNYSVFDLVNASLRASNRALLRADAYCQNNQTCPIHAYRGSVLGAFHAVKSAAAFGQLNASQCINSPKCKSPVEFWEIQQGMQAALGGSPDFPQILEALATANQGDGSMFAMAVGNSISGPRDAWANVHTCNDQDLGVDNFENFRKSFYAAEQIGPPFNAAAPVSPQNAKHTCSNTKRFSINRTIKLKLEDPMPGWIW